MLGYSSEQNLHGSYILVEKTDNKYRIYRQVAVRVKGERKASLKSDGGAECSERLAMERSPGRAFQLEGTAGAKALRLQNMLGAFEAGKEANVAGVE